MYFYQSCQSGIFSPFSLTFSYFLANDPELCHLHVCRYTGENLKSDLNNVSPYMTTLLQSLSIIASFSQSPSAPLIIFFGLIKNLTISWYNLVLLTVSVALCVFSNDFILVNQKHSVLVS